jgi:lipoprotein-releasing system ATP-binding protein
VAQAAEVLIRVEGLGKTYRSGSAELMVFSDLTFDVYAGERLAIVGESGAGKSTLLHLFGGLDRASEGKIFFRQREVAGLSDVEMSEFRNREIGYVWQNHSLLPEFTAQENVMMPLLIRGVEPGAAAEAARARLEEVGLGSRAAHRAGELSGGEQQRVALARALVGKPSVLLADEPTGNLDYKTGDMVMDLLEELHRAHGLTSIFVTHNLGFAGRADRIIKLEKGHLEVSVPSGAPLRAGSRPDGREEGNAYV